MQLAASDFYTYIKPSKCSLRIFLKAQGEKESSPSPFEEVLFRLGEIHEGNHLETFPSVIDLSSGPLEDRRQSTIEQVHKQAPVIYHPLLRISTNLSGNKVDIFGEPDFFINDGDNYIIRDSKLSKRISEKDHPEIIFQLGIYGWLYEQTFGNPPAGLQVHSGNGDILDIPYDGGASSLHALEEIVSLKDSDSEPFSPVGWSKCTGCCFFDRCWPNAEKSKDVALVVGVDQNLAIALKDEGIRTIDDLLGSFNESSLSEFKKPHGKKTQRVGKNASSILRMAQAMSSGKEIIIKTPSIPEHANYVMFDLEGIPPFIDELEKIYLWGLQVFGEKKSEFIPATAGFGPDGDKQCWLNFLTICKDIFDEYGDLPFVHWAVYEKTKIKMYIERFGDPEGIAGRVLNNLLDLLPITRDSIALPLPSYSLKVVEKYIGFKRTQEEYGGEWSMAQYIEAVETEDEDKRQELMDQIMTYNKEDLEATWAVLEWLKSKT